MKPTSFRRFYIIISIILAGAAAVPFWHFMIMLREVNQLQWPDIQYFYDYPKYNPIRVIPFAAVSIAILAGFLVLPLTRKALTPVKRFVVFAGAVAVFIGMELYAEMIAGRLDATKVVLTSRMMRTPEEIAAMALNNISWPVRIHYFIFSIILILAVLNLLYNLTAMLYGDNKALYGGNKSGKRMLVMHAIATACYTLAYVFVRVMQYDEFGQLRILWESVVNAAVCFILAALAVGLFCGSLFRSAGVRRFIPSLLSLLTVLALYAAEYVMLEYRFYSYSANVVANVLLRVLFAAAPTAAVYFLLRKFNTPAAN